MASPSVGSATTCTRAAMQESTRLRDLTVVEFARRLASDAPTPGGGSAAALSAALGASLVSMVTGLTTGRPEAAGAEDELRSIAVDASAALSDLLGLMEADATAYEQVVRARQLPRTEPREKQLRAASLRAGLAEAARVPLQTARRAADVLHLAERLAAVGNPNALSDVTVASDLALTGLRGGLANVDVNLRSLPAGDPLPAELAGEVAELEAAATRGIEPIARALAARSLTNPSSSAEGGAARPAASRATT